MQQFRWALVPTVALLAFWVLGKLIARGRATVDTRY